MPTITLTLIAFKYDNLWAKQLVGYKAGAPGSTPLCTFGKPQVQCIAPFDNELTKNRLTQSYLKLLASETRSYQALLAMTVMTAGKFGYGGFLDNVNLCDHQV